MLTREDDIDVHALRRQGWTITAIARHLGRDRKTIRTYLAGERQAGVRARTVAGPFEVFAPYCAQRLADDPHLWASTLFDELRDLGYIGSYPTMTRQIRTRGLRPACEPCRPATGRPIAVIDHPPGQETQWDWVELPDPPTSWGWGVNARLLVGALSHSGVWRGLLCESEDQPHLVDGLDRVARALGGITKDWRFDRMATVITPGTGRVSASFAGVAKHYGVVVRPCPPRRGNRKGVVEKANHVAAQRFWRTLPDDVSIEEAQARLDTWCARRGGARTRSTPKAKTTVGALAAAEPLAPVPAPFPATLTVERTVSAQALVSFRGNRYSVPPELTGATVTVLLRLGSTTIDIATTPGPAVGARGGIVMARHRMAATGAGAMIRDDGHVIALEQAAMAAATSAGPHRGKVRRPPSPAALDAAAALRAPTGTESAAPRPAAVVIDLSVYAAAAAGRNTLPPR
jgi:transposase